MENLFWITTLLLFYTYFGYPVIVYLLSRLFKSQSLAEEISPEINLVMIVYNGEQFLETKITNIFSSDYPTEKINLIIISDGSNDNTVKVLKKFSDQIEFYHYDERRGKTACLNDAIAHCNKDYVVFADVRQRFASNTIRSLVSRLSDPKVGAVSGELVFEEEGHNVFSKGIDAYWRYEKFIRNNEASFSSVVGVTGAVYAIKRSLYKPVPDGVILDDVLIPMQVVMSGYRVVFEPDAIAYDYPSSDKDRERSRKIRTLAGNYQLVSLLPALLNPFKNPIIIQFVSHKLLRLVGPFLLVMIFTSNLFLFSQNDLYTLTLFIQLIAYLLAIISTVNATVSKLIIVRLIRTFITLNWYSFLGLVEYLKNKKTHLW